MKKVVVSLAVSSLIISSNCYGMNVLNGAKKPLGEELSLIAGNNTEVAEIVNRGVKTLNISNVAKIGGVVAIGMFALWDICSGSITFKSSLSSLFLGSSLKGSNFSSNGVNYFLGLSFFKR